jgi:hypothetical protein
MGDFMESYRYAIDIASMSQQTPYFHIEKLPIRSTVHKWERLSEIEKKSAAIKKRNEFSRKYKNTFAYYQGK